MIPNKYLWKKIEPADKLAAQIDKAVNQTEMSAELKSLIRQGTNRLVDQANQIRSLIIFLLNDIPPDRLLPVLYDAGFTRDELVSSWGFPAEAIVKLEAVRKQALLSSAGTKNRPNNSEEFV